MKFNDKNENKNIKDEEILKINNIIKNNNNIFNLTSNTLNKIKNELINSIQD